jgi:hypothetical protein
MAYRSNREVVSIGLLVLAIGQGKADRLLGLDLEDGFALDL